MIKPTIHTNGTSPEKLLAGYLKVRNHLFEADEALQAMEFNSRDYYPQGMQAWGQARAEQVARAEKIRALAEEMMELAIHCSDHVKEAA